METNQISNTLQTESSGTSTSDLVQPFVPEAEVPTKLDEYKDEGWSWGGFSLNWIFLLAVRKYMYLLVLLLMLVPILNILIMIGFMIFLGIKGRELARESRTFSNHEQYLGFMKGADHAGKVFAIFYILAMVPFFVIIGGIIFSSNNEFDDYRNFIKFDDSDAHMDVRSKDVGTEQERMRDWE